VHAEGERVILTGAEGRREIELTPPEKDSERAQVLPEPLCPAGRVASATGEESEEPLGPGRSVIDALETRTKGGEA
jgi:hypothetical protein